MEELTCFFTSISQNLWIVSADLKTKRNNHFLLTQQTFMQLKIYFAQAKLIKGLPNKTCLVIWNNSKSSKNVQNLKTIKFSF